MGRRKKYCLFTLSRELQGWGKKISEIKKKLKGEITETMKEETQGREQKGEVEKMYNLFARSRKLEGREKDER